ncbi:xanthine dehydrogenase family protein molybdopterin-binding subunit [Streptomyces sp. H27-D2]|uniref:xanthine dehydrogenase family protein molybdopterin-binding subunit n=1 Tax=Streptomyces sp. H27-D2 TaxID=3046304 RepID=UPI002DB5A437|nr:xanthine dehydrogenase family protein molybdopterin-binding subunit [Streptomyces sp. H27-D2]MEC4020080.1 xanthine dehydrogenase family protein molybdopterin-binding subunit [Streptomyces sp. H27-D2]
MSASTPGPPPDPAPTPALGAPVGRLEGRLKVTGAARYAAEHTPPGTVYAWPVPATIARGRVTAVKADEALAEPGALAVLTHENAPRLGEPEDPILSVLQNDRVPHHGWHVALTVARTLESARAMAAALRVEYAPEEHDVLLRTGHPGLYEPDEVNGGEAGRRERGDFDAAYEAAPVRIDATYTMSALHNHPMEPHAATARWDGDRLTVHDSSQGATTVQETLAGLFGLDRDSVTVISEHVGGGFGSKGIPRPHVVLAAMAARHTGLPVKLSLPRAQLAAVVGHRAPTVQRVRLGAGDDGVISALAHEVTTQTSTVKEFVEQAAAPARVMYTSPHSRTSHRVVALDVPSPSWMRAPGEASGMYALESAMDELAEALDLDPVELRLRNDTAAEPDSGKPFSSRHLAECLREGARRFGWHERGRERDPRPRSRREGRLLIGSGVCSSTYPVLIVPSTARAHADRTGGYRVRINATDIGTGARTVLAQIAADALGVPLERVGVEIGRSDLPAAPLAGGSAGTASWGWAVDKACRALRASVAEHGGTLPPDGLSATADTREDVEPESPYARHAFGAQFAEVQVDTDTGETRVRRLLGVFAAGRILNSRTAHSQFIGAMTMGVGMALLEGSTMDPRFGDFAERDLASYHVPACADVREIEAHWIEEDDPHLNPMGSKGIGEIGIVGTAAAIGNAVRHASGVRVRDLPIHPDKLLPYL